MKELTTTFFPNLDGLRFFAFFAVFINHAMVCLGYYNSEKHFVFMSENFLKNGDMGVSFFFVLSGFLITYLLLKEKAANGKINIKNFYIRRVLRIFPLYYLIVLLGLYVIPLAKNQIPVSFPVDISTSMLNKWYYFTFTGNIDYLRNGITNVIVGVLWSVSVEEQFYIFWPLVIAFVPKKYLLLSFMLIIVGSIGFRYFFTGGNAMKIHFNSLSCVTYLAMGAVIAFMSAKEKFINRVKTIPKYAILLMYIIGFAIIPLRLYTWKFGVHYVLVASFVPVIIAAFFAFIIIEQNFAEHSFYKISRFRFISSIGKYTYGMYCYHMVVFFVILFSLHLIKFDISRINKFGFISITITSFFATCLVAMWSYNYFEMFFLRMKERFGGKA